MLNSEGSLSGEDLAMVRLLLENCIKLLGEEDRSQVREKDSTPKWDGSFVLTPCLLGVSTDVLIRAHCEL